jgi:uncharacterized membrane-anchored protein
MKRLALLIGALALFALPPAFAARPGNTAAPKAAPAAPGAGAAQLSPDELRARFQAISERLHPQTGDIRIPDANAVLHLGENYYFLPADEARLILTDAWGNPPDSAANVLGLVFPAGKTFMDDTWGAVITWQPSGYVSDDDAASADYDELLRQIQAAEPEVNARRTAQGYPAQHMVGWAQPPAYDSRTHSVIWAQNFRIEGDSVNSLNYEIRMLGRHGVLSLNMVTTMDKLAETRQAAQRFSAQAEFSAGARYADYQPGTDRVAAYGVGGLVAAGVGAAVAQKAGLFVVLLAFLKKAGIFIVAGFALLFGWLRRVFGRRREEEEAENYYYEAQPAAEGGPGEPPATQETIVTAPGDTQPERGG